ncbi:hypothetical protein [Paenibacillus sp. Cedars]|uniref:hypothetical protein n=1 Tax=Paenibacillus sp. Cedars TaxID=1980674 RepID=UPI0011640EB8|nr:hypothetical protein [Paenibacillus sp. Cedars]AWP25918.1 hypothetical protein B9D94_04465 [Paenibacillus sp. Cedars]
MTNPVTPNIGLNKIDRTSPSTTYFDLDKYIDQNADAVDQFAGEASEAIGALEKRLDTEERREVVLQPGLQIVNAERSAPFKLSGIKGRTLVNLLGRDGGCESVNRWSAAYQTSVMLDTGMKEGGSSSLKVSATGTASFEHYIDHEGIPVKVDAHYILVGMAKPSNNKSKAYMRIYGLDSNNEPNNIYAASNTVEDTASFKPVVLKFKPTAVIKVVARLQLKDSLGNEIYIQDGQSGNFDSIRIYEISATEYTALDSMTPEQIAAKYPYVDSVQPVRNPYVIRYGENLLPPFYEWFSRLPYRTEEPYTVFGPAIPAQVIYIDIPVLPGIVYTLSFGSLKCDYVAIHDISGVNAGSMGYLVKVDRNPAEYSPYSVQFTGPNSGVVRIHLYAYDLQSEIDGEDRNSLPAYDIRATSPMLTFGSTPKPFKPREDAMLALQTDLYADPLTGANADEVSEKDGQYFKLAKWRKVVLDGSVYWGIYKRNTGFKDILSPIANIGGTIPISHTGVVTKYDGSLVLRTTAISTIGNGNHYLDTANVVISIANSDSGWGDDYPPDANEIKAYFMGWTMRNMSASPYNDPTGAAQKTWTPIGYTPPANWNSTWEHLRTSVPVNEVSPSLKDKTIAPYQLVYQLATPTIEPIVSEGMLTFNEGSNQIEVGTGLVVQESVKPKQHANTNWIINNTGVGTSLSNKVSAIKVIYRDSFRDYGWTKETVAGAWGTEQAYTPNAKYDPSAAYSATYLTLDKSPIVPFSGSYASNEKAMLQELTDAVQQHAIAVSVLMNKKVDKDAPGWITPTLLNGWRSPWELRPPMYKKINKIVYLAGRITGGVVGITERESVFILPVGYRPEHTVYTTVNDATFNSRYICITPSGHVNIETGSNEFINIDGVYFITG